MNNGVNLKLTSRVALLTRNIVIEGASYPEQEKQSFGARVIVGKAVIDGVSRAGQWSFTSSFFMSYARL